MEWLWLVPGLLAAGAVGGVLAGLFGVGVGVVLVPVMAGLLPLPGVDEALLIKLAIGTSLAMTAPTSWLAAQRHARGGTLDAGLLRRWAPGMVLGVLAGVALAGLVPGAVLIAVFGVTSLLVAFYVGLAGPGWRLGEAVPKGLGGQGLAALVGGVSAAMGVGGGTLGVPALVLFGVPVARAVGTAGGFGVLIAVPATLGMIGAGWGLPGRGFGALGFVSLPGVALMLPVAMLATPWGVRLAQRLPARLLRSSFAVLMALLGLRMLYGLY